MGPRRYLSLLKSEGRFVGFVWQAICALAQDTAGGLYNLRRVITGYRGGLQVNTASYGRRDGEMVVITWKVVSQP